MSAPADDEAAFPGPLAEPVRQRLVQIAAEVLGSMAADEVPQALRAVARFTPAKRARLAGAALSAALDADERFRARVAEVVVESTPHLVEAVRRREPTPASDPVDTAVVAYLVRPDGWGSLVARISAQWADEQAGRDAAAEENARLRAELAAARSQLRAQAGELRQALAAAGSTSEEETARLRTTLRVRTGELRAAERALTQTAAELESVRAELAAAGQRQDAELQRLRARIAELQRAAETTRRDARVERDVDAARLRLLVDALTDAAAGIRRELALPAGVLRPADAVASGIGGAATSGTSVPGTARDAAQLDRLLALPQVHLIVDGYNVTKSGYPELSLADQRTRLVASMASVHARVGAETTVVFDGGARPPAQPRTPRGVRVLFSAPDELADDLIRRLVAAEPTGRAIVVVTSDQEIVRDVRRAGAWTVPSVVLLQRLG